MKKIILKIFIVLVTFNVIVFASTTVSTEAVNKTVEVSLDSFGTFGIVIMLALSSLLGAFFLKDEFSSLVE